MTWRDDRFDWRRFPDGAAFLSDLLGRMMGALPAVRSLAGEFMVRTSTHLGDWLDHLVLVDGKAVRAQLADLGFQPEEVPVQSGDAVYHHPAALFPRLLLRSSSLGEPGAVLAAAVQVESVTEFLMMHQVVTEVEGDSLSPYRRARVWEASGREFWVVERRGYAGFVPAKVPPDYSQHYLRAGEKWSTRPRRWHDIALGMQQTLRLAQSLVGDLGQDAAAWIAFEAERAYWQRRNWAGQVQRSRQDSLGLGWANHDHHTFRSSREHFALLIKVLETLGFRPRERFYAGAEAGWGAQVMEQPACRFAVFADVDLSPDEAEGDFAHEGLAPRQELGTVGLWCALHGESLLTAGLHHLAGRFAFDVATDALAERGVEMMAPFSEFSYLRQAFTRGERWQVSDDRLERLVAAGQITSAQRERFASQGAVGSHLENIERAEGFKGFNQQTISDIIRRTDPRAEQRVA
jgi:hypothetical protein